jgi:hypothetical protein
VLYGFRCWACLGPRSLLISVPCAQLVLGSFGLFWTVFDFRLQTSGLFSFNRELLCGAVADPRELGIQPPVGLSVPRFIFLPVPRLRLRVRFGAEISSTQEWCGVVIFARHFYPAVPSL